MAQGVIRRSVNTDASSAIPRSMSNIDPLNHRLLSTCAIGSTPHFIAMSAREIPD
jgi:hypothetical protein